MKVLTKILILTIVFGAVMLILEMNISHGAVSISSNKSTVYPGDQFTVTVTVSGVAAWNVHVYGEGPVSGGNIKLVGDSPDGNNTSYSQSATFTATGIGTIRFYTSNSDTTSNQNGEGVRSYPSASTTVSVVEKPPTELAPQPSTPSSNTTKPSNNTSKPSNTTKPAETKPVEEAPIEGPTEEDLAAVQVVIDMINALDNMLESFAEDVIATREAYEALTDAQKELVTNYEELLLAEEELNKEEVEQEPEEVEEKGKKEPIIISMPLLVFIGLQAGIIVVEAAVIAGFSKYLGKRKKH